MKKLLAVIMVAGLAFIACQKEYSIENNTDFGSTGAWEFKDSANKLFAGNPVEYYVDDTTDPSSAHMVYIGATASLDGNFSLEVFFPTGTAAAGTYTSALGQVNFSYRANSGLLYKAEGTVGQFSTENVSVTITQISDTTVTGTFSGIALDSANRLRIVKEGKFTYKKRTTTPTATVSTGTLGSVVDSCTGASITGTYRKGTAMTATNTVTVTANVSTAGTYTIYSDTLKGIHFYGTGTFLTTGTQSVTIPAVGTPTDSGTVRFRIRYGTSFCTFLVKIDTAGTVVTPTGDYLPTTANSNWSYRIFDQTNTQIDTLYEKSTGTNITLAGNTFTIFTDSDGDSSYYRKGGGLYYQADDVADFIGGTSTFYQTNILKDNVANASTWADSLNITFNGVPAKLKVTYTITAKAVAATVGTLSFSDVIKVNAVYVVTPTALPVPFTVAGIETWYARGTGIIFQKYTDNTAVPVQTAERRLTRSQIF